MLANLGQLQGATDPSTRTMRVLAGSASQPACTTEGTMEDSQHDQKVKEYQPRFGRLLVVCALAVVFCGFLVWFAGTYLTDCCGP